MNTVLLVPLFGGSAWVLGIDSTNRVTAVSAFAHLSRSVMKITSVFSSAGVSQLLSWQDLSTLFVPVAQISTSS